jgi:hypothetical protein
MRQVVIASLAALFAMATLSASAQAPAPTDPKLAAAMDFVQASNLEQRALDLIDAMEPIIAAQIRRERPTASDAAISAFQKAFKEEMRADIGSYVDGCARIYASHFSVDELRALSVFWRSNLGQKVLAETPAITKEVIPLGQAWGAAAGVKAVKAARERIKQNGYNL